VIERLRAKLVEIKKGHPGQEEQFKAACGIIIKYLGNIARSPQEDKFRSIKTSNAAFQSKVACLQGNIEFLEMCGFMVGGWQEGLVRWRTLLVCFGRCSDVDPSQMSQEGHAVRDCDMLPERPWLKGCTVAHCCLVACSGRMRRSSCPRRQWTWRRSMQLAASSTMP
jgi:hypothetical protein